MTSVRTSEANRRSALKSIWPKTQEKEKAVVRLIALGHCLVQIGNGRAGFYSYDWIDNAGRPSTREIIPEYQHVEVGDLVPMLPGTEVGMWVKGFEANRWMLWWDKKGEATWAWDLYPQDEGRTRMISRLRVRYAWTSPMIIYYLIQDVGDIVMLRKRMLGIKERAERGTATRTANRAQGRSE